MSRFLLHSELETKYYLALVQRDRAGTSGLKTHFDKQLKELKNHRLDIKNRVASPSKISEEDRHVYYSSWLYGAVYVMTSIPRFQDPRAMALHLGVPTTKVLNILQFLISLGLVKKEKGLFVLGGGSIHLDKRSSQITKHHLNWRVKAMSAIETSAPENLHYSLIMAISEKDAARIKGKIVNLIEEVNSLLPPSPEEVVQALTIDQFYL